MGSTPELEGCGLLVETGSSKGVAQLKLNRPERRNALNTRLIEGLISTLDALAEDSRVRVLVLSGAGTTFCAGADLTEFRDLPAAESAVRVEARIGRLTALENKVEAFPKPLIVAIDGPAVGAGVRLAMGADMVCMGRTAKLSFPEVAIGRLPVLLVGPLVRALGYQQAFALLLGGRVLDGEDALASGLAHRVTEPGEALSAALESADAMAALDPVLVRSTKALLQAARRDFSPSSTPP